MLTYRDLNGVMSNPCPRLGIHSHGVMIMRLKLDSRFVVRVDLRLLVYLILSSSASGIHRANREPEMVSLKKQDQ